MAHGFFPHAGFLIDGAPGSARAPYREEFMLLDAAAHECSLERKCRGFTLSASHMQDDRLHFVRFFSHNRVALSGDWITHLKEPTHAHAYEFVPGFLLPAPARRKPSAGDLAADEDEDEDTDGEAAAEASHEPLVPIHAESTTLFDAQRYCDAEPSCEGFTLRRLPSDGGDGGGNAAGEAHLAWIIFAGRPADWPSSPSTQPHERSVERGLERSVITAYDQAHVSYLRGLRTRQPSPHTALSSGGALSTQAADPAAALYILQLGYLGGTTLPSIRQAQMQVADGRRWCAANPHCAGFSTSSTPQASGGSNGVTTTPWLTFWGGGGGGGRLTFSSDWISYVRADSGCLGGYLQQPGYLQSDGYGSDGSPELLWEGSMDLEEARWWCDRREACAGFSLSVAVPPSVIATRTEEENGRAWVRTIPTLSPHASHSPQ